MVPARILHFYSPPPLFLWAFALSWLLLLKFYQFCLPFKKNYYVLVFSLFLVLILFISSLTLVITSLHEFSIFISFKRLLHVLSNFFLDPWLHRCTPFNLHTSMQLPKFNLLVTHKLIPLQFTNVWFLFLKKFTETSLVQHPIFPAEYPMCWGDDYSPTSDDKLCKHLACPFGLEGKTV